MTKFETYIRNVRKKGKQYFTLAEIKSHFGASDNSIRCGLYKLRKRGDIVSPARGLYIIVPPENLSMGCIPAEELVPILMNHWGIPYYSGLLTASLYHGASHQKPQVFQVLGNQQKPPIVCGTVKIDFIYKKSLESLPISQLTVKTGYLKIASPELVALDLLTYPKHSGGMNHTATVLAELVESLDVAKLILLAQQTNTEYHLNRIGYIVENIEIFDEQNQCRTINALKAFIDKNLNKSYVPLSSDMPTKGYSRCERWRIIENATVESDL